MDQVALLAQQDPEHPRDKTQQGQQRHLINKLKDGRLKFLSPEFSATWMTENIYQYVHSWWWRWTSSSPPHKLHCSVFCRYVAVFISIPLCRLAKPPVPQSHLWSPGKWLIWKYNHSILDFISFLSDSRSLPVLHLSYHFRHIHISLSQLSLSISLFQWLFRTLRQRAPFLTYFNTPFMTCLTTLHFFLHWMIHLEVLSCAEQQSDLLRERWRASYIQSNSLHRQDTHCLVYSCSIKCFTCH